MLGIWSWRHSIARGWHWVHERDCEAPTAHEWLIVFRKGEPDTRFALSAKKPRSYPGIAIEDSK
jgi:hypothetical protein